MALDPIINGDIVTFTAPNQTVSDDLGYGHFYTSGFDANYSGTLTQGLIKYDVGRLLLTGTLDFPHVRQDAEIVVYGGILAASGDVWGDHGVTITGEGIIEITGGLFTTEVSGYDFGGRDRDGGILVTGVVTINSLRGGLPFYGPIRISNGGDLTILQPRFTFDSERVEIDGTSTLRFDRANYVIPILVADGATIHTDRAASTSAADVFGGVWNKNGTGQLTLLGAGSSASNGVNVNAGRLVASYANLPLAVQIAQGAELEIADTVTPGQSLDGTVAGTISGEGALVKSGNGVLTLVTDHSFTGGTTITGGTLRIGDGGTRGSMTGDIVNDGNLYFDRADNMHFDGTISGSGHLLKEGTGSLELTGFSDYDGQTTVRSGRLVVNGQLTQTFMFVEAGALLGGSGSVHSFILESGGRLSPGNSVGTLNVLGDAYFEAGTFFDVEIEGDRSDVLQVAGEAGIQGGTINVFGAAGGASSGRYTILTAANGVTGRFDAVADDLPDVDFVDVYDGTSVQLTARATANTASVSSKTNGVAATAGVIETASTFTSMLGGRMSRARNPRELLRRFSTSMPGAAPPPRPLTGQWCPPMSSLRACLSLPRAWAKSAPSPGRVRPEASRRPWAACLAGSNMRITSATRSSASPADLVRLRFE